MGNQLKSSNMARYGRRLRISPEEEQMILRIRSGIDKTPNLKRKLPKIFLTDIETAPLKAYIWDLKTRYVQPGMLDEENDNWWMLSWAGKWLLEEEVFGAAVTPEQAKAKDDNDIVTQIWHYLNEADIVITHNGKKFDHRMLNMRFLLHGLPPPSPYKVIDTLMVTRSKFMLPSYRLSYIADILGVSEKIKHEGIGMWKKCLRGEEEALVDMLTYNIGDIVALEDFYLIIRPWITNHPNIGIYTEDEEPVCPVCGNAHLIKIEGNYSTTAVSKFENYRCAECGHVSKKRQSALPLSVRKALLTGAN